MIKFGGSPVIGFGVGGFFDDVRHEFDDALARVRHDEDELLASVSGAEWIEKHKAPIAIGAVAFSAAVVGGIVYWITRR